MSYFDNELLICYETGTVTYMLSYRVDGFHVMVLTNSTTHQENHACPRVDTQKQKIDFSFESQKTWRLEKTWKPRTPHQKQFSSRPAGVLPHDMNIPESSKSTWDDPGSAGLVNSAHTFHFLNCPHFLFVNKKTNSILSNHINYLSCGFSLNFVISINHF